jgi:RNA polymerase sigma factor (sigma-70 family)
VTTQGGRPDTARRFGTLGFSVAREARSEIGARDFEDFYALEYPRVMRAVVMAVGSTELASDATQEAFKRAFVRWNWLRDRSWRGGWVMTTALNLCRRHLRREAMGRRLTSTAVAASDAVVSDGPVEERIDLVRELRQLPFRQRQALVLFYLGDLPLPTVADLMKISEGAVKSHLARARAALKDVLEVADAPRP